MAVGENDIYDTKLRIRYCTKDRDMIWYGPKMLRGI